MNKFYAFVLFSLATAFLTACGGSSENEDASSDENNQADVETTIPDFDVVPEADQTKPGTRLTKNETAFVPFSETDPSTVAVTFESLLETTDEELAEEGASRNDLDNYYTIRYSVQNVSESELLASSIQNYEVTPIPVGKAFGVRPVIGSNPGSLTENTRPLCGRDGDPRMQPGSKVSYCKIYSVEKGLAIEASYGDLVSWESQ